MRTPDVLARPRSENPRGRPSRSVKPRFFGENARLLRVTSELALHGEEPDASCVHCGRPAVGPCARCDAPVCGDCCVLTEGGARIYAICVGCEGRGGRSLRRAWLTVATWVAGPLALLTLAVLVLAWISSR